MDLVLLHEGQGSPRVNFSEAQLRVDQTGWEPCRSLPGAEDTPMIGILESGKALRIRLVCADIPRPYQNVEVRFPLADTAGTGMVEIRFPGLSQG